MPDFGVSPLTHTIYIGKIKPLKDGGRGWTGKKTDVTDGVLKAVFEYMHLMAKETGYYELKIGGFGVMSFVREKVREAAE